jgi:hypothetical protein
VIQRAASAGGSTASFVMFSTGKSLKIKNFSRPPAGWGGAPRFRATNPLALSVSDYRLCVDLARCELMLACSGSGARCIGMGALRRRIDDPFLCFSLKKNTRNQKIFPGLRPGGGEGPCTPWILGGAGRGAAISGYKPLGAIGF